MEPAKMDWPNLDFGYRKTDANLRFTWKDGAWSEGVMTQEETIPLHMASSCLHYGQECFEGLKAFSTRDGDVALFRIEENAARMIESCKRILMPPVPKEMFINAVMRVVQANRHYVPPYGTGASLYVRPLVIGIGPRIGVRPADEYLFIVFVTPVGPYFKTGFKPVHLVVEESMDRAAPLGVGNAKVGGNYAAGMRASMGAKERGFTEVLYLDAKHKKFIDESGPANFFAITKDGQYITPKSESILPSITNKSLITLADQMGLRPERRQIAVDEIFDFAEAGCCGTAAVITPVGSITWRDRKATYGDGETPGEYSTKLYKQLRAIQLGEAPDTHNWLTIVPDAGNEPTTTGGVFSTKTVSC
ncbi:MAG: branched-chain amino acid aminotransferase [Phycisphaerales bacterium]|nr:branched-chain amino acid aminotransferase [Phycisphaerales bacterium]MCB9856786.1 branched-chain amino acid aminotransferase [Phycisphaerales bacterium]MCB9862087.1 branched-chain amino acid aminotransferase [Phycisphaerales bacterium]